MYNNFETGLFPSSQPTSSPSSFESVCKYKAVDFSIPSLILQDIVPLVVMPLAVMVLCSKIYPEEPVNKNIIAMGLAAFSVVSFILSIIHLSFYAADKCHADNDPADTASFDYANASKQYCLTGSIEIALAVGVGFFSYYINRSQNNARDQHDIEYEPLNSTL